MIFRQLFDATSCTYTYLIGDSQTKQACLVDTVKEQVNRDLNLIKELGLQLVFCLETHVHADHITGASLLRAASGCDIYAPCHSSIPCAQATLQDQQQLKLGDIEIKVFSTPGHTSCSTCFLVNGDYLLTGDTLFIRGCGRTDFQQGDAQTLYHHVTQTLFNLADTTLVYPGHDYKGMTVSTIGEEKHYNPRFANKSEDDFIALMNNLNLPKPKLIDVAVPANLLCGQDH